MFSMKETYRDAAPTEHPRFNPVPDFAVETLTSMNLLVTPYHLQSKSEERVPTTQGCTLVRIHSHFFSKHGVLVSPRTY